MVFLYSKVNSETQSPSVPASQLLRSNKDLSKATLTNDLIRKFVFICRPVYFIFDRCIYIWSPPSELEPWCPLNTHAIAPGLTDQFYSFFTSQIVPG